MFCTGVLTAFKKVCISYFGLAGLFVSDKIVIIAEDQHKIIDRIRVQDKVSIIFADIVGFTRMSSGKSASQLVELLSDLFGRFDDLCEFTGCEKMATLGKTNR